LRALFAYFINHTKDKLTRLVLHFFIEKQQKWGVTSNIARFWIWSCLEDMAWWKYWAQTVRDDWCIT